MNMFDMIMGAKMLGSSGGSADAPTILENLPLGLDFTNGDQLIVAPEGKLVKSAIIQKPDDLKPENIAEGVNIAGIVGALAAGGGGGVKIASGTFNGTGVRATINHNLGVVPDVVIVGGKYAGDGELLLAFGYSAALVKALGFTRSMYHIKGAATNFVQASFNDAVSIENVNDARALTSANESSVFVGGTSSGYPKNGWPYEWIAIGGLT